MAPRHRAARQSEGVHQASRLVARGLRAVPRAHARGEGARAGASGRRRSAIASRRARRARRELSTTRCCSTQYLQWLAARAVGDGARRRAACGCSATSRSWSAATAPTSGRARTVPLDASVGAPPDAFSETGQDWGMPAYRWDAIAAAGFRWLRERAPAQRRPVRRLSRRSLVGFFRTYAPRRGTARAPFVPGGRAGADRPGRAGARLSSRAAAREIIAEDLGLIPGFRPRDR